MLCIHCGKPVPADAATRPQCGKTLPALVTPANGGQTDGRLANARLDAVSPKNRRTLSLLAGLLGFSGVHRFHAGRILAGLLMLASFLPGILSVLRLVGLLPDDVPDSQPAAGLAPLAVLSLMCLIGLLPFLMMRIWPTIVTVPAICGRDTDGDGRHITHWGDGQPPRPGAGDAPHAAQRLRHETNDTKGAATPLPSEKRSEHVLYLLRQTRTR